LRAWAAEPVPRHTPNRRRREAKRRAYIRDDFTCVQCGAQENLTIDHVQPKAEGGRTVVENLQVMCRPCNEAKGCRWPWP
jgi:5-methylcytosine-specific restriction endonuclease McrA